MTVRAISNDYGSEGTTQPLTWGWLRVRKSNGSVTNSDGSSTHAKDSHIRDGHTSNPVVKIDGMIPFRNPSSYSRAMVNLIKATPADYTHQDAVYSYRTWGYPQSSYAEYPRLWTFPVNRHGRFQPSWDEDRAVTECLAKLGDRKVDLGTMLAESVKSANQIADLARTLWQDMLDYSRRIKSFKRNPWGISREVANGYLGFKYGIKPLANDLYKSAQIWNGSSLAERPLVVSASANVINRYSNTEDTDGWRQRNQRVTNLAQCKIFATISSDFKRTANQIGLADPLGVAWELVPYSFVVDWALPLGTFLEALNASVGLDFLCGYKMQRTSTKVIGTRPIPSNATGTASTFSYEALNFRRKALGGFPTPKLYAKNPFSTGNVLSALALYRQLLRDR